MEQFKGQPRLPKFALPKRYDLRLKPDLKACKFSGSVAILVDIVSETRFIVLNAAELSVNAASVFFTHTDSSKASMDPHAKVLLKEVEILLELKNLSGFTAC
ncbi:hypothetical protein FF1_016983 [Malus domestica]